MAKGYFEEDLRKVEIEVYSGKELVHNYLGKFYFYYNDYKNDGCVHFRDEDGKHYRFYNATVLVKEV